MSWAPAYCSATELAHYNGDASVGSDTAELDLACEAASRSVDRACDRQFGQLDDPQARLYTATRDYSGRWIVQVDDFATVDGLVVESVGAPVDTVLAGCVPTPVNAVLNGSVWTSLILPSGPVRPGPCGGVRVTAQWGWPEVPPAVALATLIQGSRLYARRNAPFGVAGDPEVGQMRLLDKLDVDLITAVRPYLRLWGAV